MWWFSKLLSDVKFAKNMPRHKSSSTGKASLNCTSFVHSLFFRNVVVFKTVVCCETLPRHESPLTGKALVNCTSFVHSLCFRKVVVFKTASASEIKKSKIKTTNDDLTD